MLEIKNPVCPLSKQIAFSFGTELLSKRMDLLVFFYTHFRFLFEKKKNNRKLATSQTYM